MTLEADDWTVERSSGNIRYTGDDHLRFQPAGSPSYATVIEFHRWLQGLADDAIATGDDELDITNTLPSQRSTDNIITLINSYNIDDTASEHLYDGSIIQNNGEDIYDGIVNFGNADVLIQIIQNGDVIADDWWNDDTNGSLNASAESGISHRFMIKTRSGGNDVDKGKLIGTCRRFNYTYSEFTINATARGNNVLALTDAADLNNTHDEATVGAWSTNIVNGTEGYALIDINDTTGSKPYYSEWAIGGSHTMNDFYEYAKYLTRDGSAETLYGLKGTLFRGITHQVAISSPTGTFVEPEDLSWGTGVTAGTGQLLAIDSTTNGTKMWIQLLTGATPTGTITGNGGATAIAGAVSERTISKPFVGASTGSALIGSYGLGLDPTDLSASDSVTDLNGLLHNPPNNVTYEVTGLVNGEDRVLVAPRSGVDSNGDPAINKTQMTIKTGYDLTTNDITSVTVTSIPAGSYPPTEGYIRVTDDDGFERRLHYSAVDTGTGEFTISGGDYGDGNEDFGGAQGSGTYQASAGNGVYFAYIDELASDISASFTTVHSDVGTLDMVIIVRDGGATPIKQYIAPWTETNSSNAATAIRTSDT